jgi:hypothetical protein
MTTGDGAVANDFTAAAHSAQADVLRLDPLSLKNKTTPRQEQDPYYSGASLTGCSSVVVVLVAALQLAFGVL